MKPMVRRIIHGAVGGTIGAACMTAVRMLARRARIIDQMVPQAVETWTEHHLVGPAHRTPSALHHAADQMMHLGYGLTFGAVYGASLGRRRATSGKVLGYGVGVWVFGSFVLLPALKVLRPEWQAKPVEVAVNLGSHLVYAATLALLSDELELQSRAQPRPYPLSALATTG